MNDGTFEFSSRWPTNAFTIYEKNAVEIMRVSAEGVTVNPDIPADDAARAVLSVLDQQIKQMVEQAVAAEREACAKVCEDSSVGMSDAKATGAEVCAAAIRARGEK